MSEHDPAGRRSLRSNSFWTSRAGIVLVGFLAVAGLLLTYEHRVHVLTGNGVLVALLLVCVGMHFFMHGGHGGHGGGGEDSGRGARR